MSIYFRIHPAINIARVGSSSEYYIAPETAAGELVDPTTGLFGGLPIKAGSENTPIEDVDLRDADHNPKRQAARFRIYAYEAPQEMYPGEDPGSEITIGSKVGGRTVKDIVWTVHLANKKNNNYSITTPQFSVKDGVYVKTAVELGIAAYDNGALPPLRNPEFGPDPSSAERRTKLTIDAGPRALAASTDGKSSLAFDAKTTPCYADQQGHVLPLSDYPVSFPDDHFTMFNATTPIDTLGEMTIEAGTGRLIVAGGYGRASAIEDAQGNPPPLADAIDNDGWFDDTSDGPVTATLLFDDGSTQEAVHAWVVCTDPGYAPQTRNVNSVWDDVYATWVEQLDLVPGMYANGAYRSEYKASFDTDILPVFHGAFLQRWNTNLPSKGINGHNFVANIKPGDDPKAKIPSLTDLIRNPNPPSDPNETPDTDLGVKMPLALGDAMQSFLAVTTTQYFLLNQWYDGRYSARTRAIGAGEKLDRVVMENLLGGRYSPGIDLTFIVRDVNLYAQNWRGTSGPFRINMQPLDYHTASKGQPFLQEGYVPLRTAMVEPGDLCKFMSQPWHTDYNSCATHTPDPNPVGNNTLYWSWPAQRPVNVYRPQDCTYSNGAWHVGGQVFSVRGAGTDTPYPQQQGRYQCYWDFVENWEKIGFVIQGLQIPAAEGVNYGKDLFLEVASLFEDEGQPVPPWPTPSEPGYQAPTDCGPHKKS